MYKSQIVDDPIWDICEAIGKRVDRPFYELVSRGHLYFSVVSREKFIDKCQQFQVRFVQPIQTLENDLSESLLNLFNPIEFDSSKSLHVKAKELDCVPFNGASDIQYLQHIAAEMYKNGHKLFYFKKAFSEIELKHLVMVDGFSKAEDKENIYLSGNQNTGVLYVIENLKKESKK